MGNKKRNHLNLRQTSTTHGDVNKKQMLSFKELDDNFIFLKERDVKEIKLTGNDLVYETLGGDEITVDLSSLGGGGSSLWTESGDDIRFDTGDVYIGWSRNRKHLDVNGNITADLGFTNGTYEYGMSGSIINGHAGTSTGSFSATLGVGNTATGYATLAIGTNVVASGQHSFAGGYSPYSHLGFDVVASGEVSFSFLESTNNYPQVGALADNSVALGGKDNIVYNQHSSILGGRDNVISGSSEHSAIIGGSDNRLESNANRSVILGGANIVATEAMTAYVSRLNIGWVGSETANKLLAVDSNGKVVDGSSLASGGGGGGDVSKVNTPANNQVGVWTGDGTIEGDSNFTWNGTTLEVENNYDGNTSLVISNINNTSNSTSYLTVKGKDSSGAVGSGSLIYYGANFVPSGGLLGTFIPESLTLLTGGGTAPNRAHINLASRRSDGEVRVFTGSDDLDTSSIRLKVGNSNTTIYNDLIVNDDTYFDGAILQTGVNFYGTSDKAINLTNKSIIRFELNNTITGPSIGAGTAGQRIILYVDSGTGNTTIDVTNGLDFTEIVFSSIADSVEMIYDNNKWLILSIRGATIS